MSYKTTFLRAGTGLVPRNVHKITDSTKTRSVFIISTGRTGTKFFETFFNDPPDVVAMHEPKPSRILRMWSNARLENRVSARQLAPVLLAKRKKFVDPASPPKIYIESNPFAVGFTEVFSKVFDKPVIIHVVRDPRDYIKSALNHGNTRGLKKLFNDYVPFWYPDIKSIQKLPKDPGLMTRTAHYWKIVNKHIIDTCQDRPDYHLFKFENLFSGDSNTLTQLAKAIGVDKVIKSKDLRPKNQSKDRVIQSWQDWSAEECQLINDICQPYMGQYGYGTEPEWRQKLKS